MVFGDLIAVEKDNSILGNVISKFTYSKITHVGMVLYGDYFIESSAFGIRISNIEKLKNKNYWRCELTDDNLKKIRLNRKWIESFVEEQLQSPYDFLQLGLFIPYILSFGLYTPKENNKLYVCSELVAAVYEKAGILQNVNTSVTTPADLFNMSIYAHKEYTKKGQDGKDN